MPSLPISRARALTRPIAIVGAAVLVIAGTSVVAASGAVNQSAASAVPSALPSQASAGLVLLQTGTTNKVSYDSDGNGVADSYPVQTLSNASKGCGLVTDNSILGIDGINSGGGGQAGLVSGSIGVADAKTDRSIDTSAKSCGLVDSPSQSLVLKVGSAISAAHPLYASALLDVELKGNAQIQAIAYRGTTPVGLYELRSGRTVTNPIATSPPAGYAGPGNVVFSCLADKADSAPDAGVASNCRWPISSPSWVDTNNDGVNESTGDDGVYFDKLVLQAVNGGFSLEGGSDGVVAGSPSAASGLPQTASFFEVPGPLTNCNDPALTVSGSGTTDPSASVIRTTNTDGVGTCQPMSVTITSGPNSLGVLKPINAQTTAQFIVTVTWNLAYGPSGVVPHQTQIDWQTSSTPTYMDVPICDNPDVDSTTGVLRGVTVPITAAQDMVANTLIPGIQYACVGTSKMSKVPGATTVQFTDQIYLLGDPYMRG